MLRFVSTGTEATMAAIRVARGTTGRDKIIKIEGGFHGAHDSVLIKAGSGATTLGVPDSKGVPADTAKNTLQVPYNDLALLEKILKRSPGQIAALIIEPVLGNIGPVLPRDGYLQGVRALTEENDVLLDLRRGNNWLSAEFGWSPGVLRCRARPYHSRKDHRRWLPCWRLRRQKRPHGAGGPQRGRHQAGTFNGSPVSLAAGSTTLDVLEKENILEKLNAVGDEMRKALSEIVNDFNLGYSVTGIASMFKVFFGPLPWDYESALRCDKSGYISFFRRMLDSGIFLTPSQFETDFISAAHSKDDIDKYTGGL